MNTNCNFEEDDKDSTSNEKEKIPSQVNADFQNGSILGNRTFKHYNFGFFGCPTG